MQASCPNPWGCRVVFAMLFLLSAESSPAADWPQYRGPNHDGISPEHIRTNWTAQPPQQLWKVPLGAGLSSLTIQNGRVFTMERHGDTITGRSFPRTASGVLAGVFSVPQADAGIDPEVL